MSNLRIAFKTALAKTGKTATQAAEDMQVNRKTLYSAFYTGNPCFSTIERAAQYFNMKTSEFVALGE